MKARDQVAKHTMTRLQELFIDCEAITDEDRVLVLLAALACAAANLHAMAGREALAEAFSDLYGAAGAAEVLHSAANDGGPLQ